MPEPRDAALARALLDAERHGIISAAQRAAIEQLAEPGPAPVEPPRGVNPVTVAYGLGAAAVIYALGWFLADRWKSLGPWGIAGVGALYALLCAATARVVAREGFRTAAGIATLLAAALVPLIVFGVGHGAGLWPASNPAYCGTWGWPFPECVSERITLELVAVAAALIAIRIRAFGPIALIPFTILATLAFDLHIAIWESDRGAATGGWNLLTAASIVATVAYLVDRRQSPEEDYARWGWLTASYVGVIALGALWNAYDEYHPLLGAVAVVIVTLAVWLRRRSVLLVGVGTTLWFIGWLASKYFKGTLVFPLALAGLGVATIIVAVWVQRRGFLRRSGDAADRRVPLGATLFIVPAFLAAFMHTDARARDHEARVSQRTQQRAARARDRMAPKPTAPNGTAETTGGDKP
ncbi:MAG: DUF2157 domain-containing protein [Gemmatimonadaceae bacterium]|nr:DUF2157 domain-containing protein [Gemmatimonadaceae bacterium]